MSQSTSILPSWNGHPSLMPEEGKYPNRTPSNPKLSQYYHQEDGPSSDEPEHSENQQKQLFSGEYQSFSATKHTQNLQGKGKKPHQTKTPLPRGSACTVCRSRKLKCDGTRPACLTCTRCGRECRYGDPLHERLIATNKDLQEQIRILEAELERFKIQPDVKPNIYHSDPTQPYSVVDYSYNGAPPGFQISPQLNPQTTPDSTGTFTGFPPAWSTPMSGERKPITAFVQAPNQQRDALIPSVWAECLPPIDTILELVNVYFSTLHQHFPFIHRARFMYSIHHPNSLMNAPSSTLILAILAVAARYHDDETIRSNAMIWYDRARELLKDILEGGMDGSPTYRHVQLTIEVVQALVLLVNIEMGSNLHQRCFMTIGQAIRVSQMLGLYRMDEDRIAVRMGFRTTKRLRPPVVRPLPVDPVLLEEYRRTMWAVFVVDRYQSSCVGWPLGIQEMDIRLLLPCLDDLYETGRCDWDDNMMMWPVLPDTIDTEDSSRIGPFGWLIRVCWLGSRVQSEVFRPNGFPAEGPLKTIDPDPTLERTDKVIQMDYDIAVIREKLHELLRRSHKTAHGAIYVPILILHGLMVNFHHLRLGYGLQIIPYNPNIIVTPGSADYSLRICVEGMTRMHQVVSSICQGENNRTALSYTRITTFASFTPYILYSLAFVAKFAIGEWSMLSDDRSRTGDIPTRLPDEGRMPSSDEVFGPNLLSTRMLIVDTLCDSLDRIGSVWPIGNRFATMIRADQTNVMARQYNSPGHVSATIGQ